MLQYKPSIRKLRAAHATYIDEYIVGYVINHDAFTETLINKTIAAVLGNCKRGIETRRRRKTSELNTRVEEWQDTNVYIYVQCTGPSLRPFESTRTSRLGDREEIEICDDCADEISVSLNGGLSDCPERTSNSKGGASLPQPAKGM